MNKKTYLEYIDGSSSKFWEIEKTNFVLTTRYGRIGNKGVVKTDIYHNESVTNHYMIKKIMEKKRKGYKEVDSNFMVVKQSLTDILKKY
jgi:predicted DNA-binding WGR domain protein